jgi:hypothetical protein
MMCPFANQNNEEGFQGRKRIFDMYGQNFVFIMFTALIAWNSDLNINTIYFQFRLQNTKTLLNVFVFICKQNNSVNDEREL